MQGRLAATCLALALLAGSCDGVGADGGGEPESVPVDPSVREACALIQDALDEAGRRADGWPAGGASPADYLNEAQRVANRADDPSLAQALRDDRVSDAGQLCEEYGLPLVIPSTD
jgi:hypothetical protein